MGKEKKYYCRLSNEFTVEELERHLNDHYRHCIVDDYERKLFDIIKSRIKTIGTWEFLCQIRWIAANEVELGYRSGDNDMFWGTLFNGEDDFLVDTFDGLTADEAYDAIVNESYDEDNKPAKLLSIESAILAGEVFKAMMDLGFVRNDIKENITLSDLVWLVGVLLRRANVDPSALGRGLFDNNIQFMFHNEIYETLDLVNEERMICENLVHDLKAMVKF